MYPGFHSHLVRLMQYMLVQLCIVGHLRLMQYVTFWLLRSILFIFIFLISTLFIYIFNSNMIVSLVINKCSISSTTFFIISHFHLVFIESTIKMFEIFFCDFFYVSWDLALILFFIDRSLKSIVYCEVVVCLLVRHFYDQLHQLLLY